MTKHFCDICGKETQRNFFGEKDIFYNINSDKFGISICLLSRGASEKFIFVCEKCVMNEIAQYFISRVKKLNG